jgi:DNA-binding transcriptional regulator YiaG
MSTRTQKREVYKHVTHVGRYVVEDATGMVWQDKDGNVELTYAGLVGYEQRAARVVLQDAKSVDGAVLRFARKALGLRQKDLATLLGYTDTHLSRIESGEDPVPRAIQLAVAELLCRVEVEGEEVLAHLLDMEREDPAELEVRDLRKAI